MVEKESEKYNTIQIIDKGGGEWYSLNADTSKKLPANDLKTGTTSQDIHLQECKIFTIFIQRFLV